MSNKTAFDQLMYDAGLTAQGCWDSFDQYDKEAVLKFAELIVRECIRVPYDMWDKAELNADVAVKIEHRIREHFNIDNAE